MSSSCSSPHKDCLIAQESYLGFFTRWGNGNITYTHQVTAQMNGMTDSWAGQESAARARATNRKDPLGPGTPESEQGLRNRQLIP